MIFLMSIRMGCPGCVQQGLNAVGNETLCIQTGQQPCGTARYLCSAADNPPRPHAQTVRGSRTPLCLLCPAVG